MPLNDAKVKNAKGAASPIKLSDAGGLYLLVQTNGSRLWRLNYRFAGKQKTLAIGAYPTVSLKAARHAREAAKAQLRMRIDPSAAKRQERRDHQLAAQNTFESVAREWLGKQDLAATTYARALRLFEKLTFPWIGGSPIADLRAPDVLAVLRRVESRGHLETARRIKQQTGSVFRYAIASGRASDDPTAALKGLIATPKTKHQAAITDPKRIGPLMRAIAGYEGSPVTVGALKLGALLFVRPGELRHAEWSEFDLDAREWRIPAAKMKMRSTHVVPLSAQAIEILRGLHPITGSGRYVLPATTGRGCPMSENTVLAALRRMGYTSDEMTGHGFRSMASTRLHEMGWSHDAIERQLSHAPRDAVSAAYNYAEHLPERRRMMQAWADYLDALRDESSVVSGNFGKAA